MLQLFFVSKGKAILQPNFKRLKEKTSKHPFGFSGMRLHTYGHYRNLLSQNSYLAWWWYSDVEGKRQLMGMPTDLATNDSPNAITVNFDISSR